VTIIRQVALMLIVFEPD